MPQIRTPRRTTESAEAPTLAVGRAPPSGTADAARSLRVATVPRPGAPGATPPTDASVERHRSAERRQSRRDERSAPTSAIAKDARPAEGGGGGRRFGKTGGSTLRTDHPAVPGATTQKSSAMKREQNGSESTAPIRKSRNPTRRERKLTRATPAPRRGARPPHPSASPRPGGSMGEERRSSPPLRGVGGATLPARGRGPLCRVAQRPPWIARCVVVRRPPERFVGRRLGGIAVCSLHPRLERARARAPWRRWKWVRCR